MFIIVKMTEMYEGLLRRRINVSLTYHSFLVDFFKRWNATFYKRFAEMDLADMKRLAGCFGAWPKDSPPKHVKRNIASEIPDAFDCRTKWPGSIHPIRDQVSMMAPINATKASIFV